MNILNKTLILATCAITTLAASGDLYGQEWARKMFKEYAHDFGKVPLGEIPEYRFEIQNVFEETIQIRSVTSSCGCTIASASKKVLAKWEKGEIVCRFNSPAVGVGFKQATVTVSFDRPYVGECQLTVSGNIVTGLTFSPETIDFGQVSESNLPVKTVKLSSAGNPNLRVVDVKSTFGHIKVLGVKETGRSATGVNFELQAQLKETVPKGYSQGELFIVVEENPRVRRPDGGRVLREFPLPFTAKFASQVQVAPQILTLGRLKPGQQINKKVFLTSDQPFRITDVRCESDAFSVRADSETKKKVHIIEVSYTGEEKSGRHECELNFYTDLKQDASGSMKAIFEIDESDQRNDEDVSN